LRIQGAGRRAGRFIRREENMASEKIVTLTDENFESEVLKSETPILVDFWAAWCGPCRAVAPLLDELAEEMDGKLRFAKLNVDEHQQTAFQFQVSSIPTFILFKGGKMADRMLGAGPKSHFQSFIGRNLEADA
jgi:thioredoxin